MRLTLIKTDVSAETVVAMLKKNTVYINKQGNKPQDIIAEDH